MTNRFARLGLRAMVWSALAASAAAQTTTRVSVSSTGVAPIADARNPSISSDARHIAFHSSAPNLVESDSNGAYDVFVRDRITGETVRASVASNGSEALGGNSWYPALSANGRVIAFESVASNLVPGDTNGAYDIFVHELETGVTTRVNISSVGETGNADAYHAALSADGRFVGFWSIADNLVPGDTNGTEDAFVHDRATGQTTRVSVSSAGGQSDNRTLDMAFSADGSIVAYTSLASNLVPDDTNGEYDVFVHNRVTGQTTRVSVSTFGVQSDHESYRSALTADGSLVAFYSLGTTLIEDDTNADWDVFLHDVTTGVTERVSVSSLGEQGNGPSVYPSLSADGRFVVFSAWATNLVPDDLNNTLDVFAHDRLTQQTILISVNSEGVQGNNTSENPSASGVSEDGSFIAFDSSASNLVPGDTNNVWDTFLRYVPPILPPLPFSADSEPAAIAIANFDVDLDVFKRPDLAVVNAASNSVSLLDNNGVVGQLPSFAPPSPERTFPVGAGPTAVAAGNLDDNPYPDLVVANTIGGTVSVLLGSPTDGLIAGPTLPAPGSPRALSLADLDRDGLQDVIVARSDADAISIFRNLGGGKFAGDQPQNVPPGGRPNGIGSGDLDNDKDIDVVACVDLAGAILVFPNVSPAPGTILFGPPQSFPVGGINPRPVSVVVKDFDLGSV